jgi:hypothetical protein
MNYYEANLQMLSFVRYLKLRCSSLRTDGFVHLCLSFCLWFLLNISRRSQFSTTIHPNLVELLINLLSPSFPLLNIGESLTQIVKFLLN